MNTIPNVPRELLEDANRSLQELAFAGELHLSCQKGLVISCACTDCMSDRAIDTHSKIRALLSAPSPAGVDGLEVVGVLCISRFRNNPAMENVEFQLAADVAQGQHDLCRLSDAQAIIDGLRGEVEELRAESFESLYNAVIDERDQFAGLLREVHDTYRAAIHWEDLRSTMKRIDAVLSAHKDA